MPRSYASMSPPTQRQSTMSANPPPAVVVSPLAWSGGPGLGNDPGRPYHSSDLATGRDPDVVYEWEYVMADVLDRLQLLEITGGGGPGAPVVIEHQQLIPAAVWTIGHPLLCRPEVLICEPGGQQLIAEVHYPDDATVVIIHGQPEAGVAYLRP